jgi:hypothetical protein
LRHLIKVPTTVPELCKLADELDKNPSEVCGLLEHALGMDWWERGGEEVTVDVSPQPPEGYVRAKGCTGHWINAEKQIIDRGWIITPAWDAATNRHTVELWTANHKPPKYANLSPADALRLASDLTAATQTALTAGDRK